MVRKLLPNAPVAEVSLEIRFHGDLSLYRVWGDIQTELRGQYPKLLVPQVVPGAAPMLQPVHLMSQDDTEVVMLAVNSFGMSFRRYPGFESFKETFGRALATFRKHCQPRLFTRFGLRYTNVLPETFPEGGVEGALYPVLKLAVAGWPGPHLEHIDQPLLVMNGNAGPVRLRVSLVPRAATILGQTVNLQTSSHGMVFDLDAYQEGSFQVDELSSFIEQAHEKIEETFFGLLTPEYLGYLEGRPV